MSLWLGANEHTIAFDSGGTQVVKLREVEWTVKEAEMDAMDPPRSLSVTVTTIFGHVTELEVWASQTIGAVKAMIAVLDGVPIARQRLLFHNQPLDDDGATLVAIGVADGAVLHLIMQADDAELEPEPEPQPEPELSCASSVGSVRQLTAEARQGTAAAREAERAAQADTAAVAAELAAARRELARLRWQTH